MTPSIYIEPIGAKDKDLDRHDLQGVPEAKPT